ncbi:MAG: 2,3-diketo-L-gulonate transporter small permease protein YiaM [Xanthobacteraceae bacterium]|jgi:TRAP-type C4-dicarboxylate transport system permease small subunit|nr:2,3-diketo-L-gulonate transporter small permease protein YiaM [Xanthobacteraceae bacterium]
MNTHHDLADFAGDGTPVDIEPAGRDVLSEFELGQHQGETIIERVVDGLVGFLGVAILLGITALVFGNATTRYLFNFTVIWADELIVASIPWLALCGMYLSIRQRQLIRIEYFLNMFPPKVRRAAEIFVCMFSAVSFCYLAVGGFNYLSLFGADTTLYLDLPTSWFTSALFIGALLVVAAFLVEAVREAAKKC